MRFTKTYGIDGLVEWYGILKCGALSMKVAFTGGGASAFGVAPATFTTSDELTQHVVEGSSRFKEGRIKIIRKIPIPGTENEEVVQKQPDQSGAAGSGQSAKDSDKDTAADQGGNAGAASAIGHSENGDGADNGDGQSDDASGDGNTDGVLRFACVDDAKDYLSEKYNVPRSTIRTRADIEAAASGLGLTITWE